MANFKGVIQTNLKSILFETIKKVNQKGKQDEKVFNMDGSHMFYGLHDVYRVRL